MVEKKMKMKPKPTVKLTALITFSHIKASFTFAYEDGMSRNIQNIGNVFCNILIALISSLCLFPEHFVSLCRVSVNAFTVSPCSLCT